MVVDPDDANLAKSLLYAEQALDDIVSVRNNGKGKGRLDELLGDEEYAAKLQFDYLQDALQIMEDFRLAKSLYSGLQGLHPPLVDQAAIENRRATLSFSIKAGLPGPSIRCDDLDIGQSMYVYLFYRL